VYKGCLLTSACCLVITLFGVFIFFANGTVFFSRTRGSEGSWAYSGKAHCAGDAACQVGPNEIQKIWGTPKVVQYGGVYLPYIMRELSHCLGYSPDRGPPFPSPLIVTYPTTHGGDSASRCHAPHDQVVAGVCLFVCLFVRSGSFFLCFLGFEDPT